MRSEKTIHDIQSELETALHYLSNLGETLPDKLKPLVKLAPPKGFRVRISLRHATNERQIKRNSPAEGWSPGSGLIAIAYEPAGAAVDPARDEPSETARDPARDIVTALAKAEQDPQLGFVSLKWFRDTCVPQQGFPWAAIPDERRRALVNAIDRKWILTSKVANPKNPQFPVTAIKVNRPLTEVRSILEQKPEVRSKFGPIAMRGEPLSQTVLRERR
jgi:hypothetical protein